MERETGFEPATSTLARSHSTTELFPLAENILLYQMPKGPFKHQRPKTQFLLGLAVSDYPRQARLAAPRSDAGLPSAARMR